MITRNDDTTTSMEPRNREQRIPKAMQTPQENKDLSKQTKTPEEEMANKETTSMLTTAPEAAIIAGTEQHGEEQRKDERETKQKQKT